MNPIRNSGFFLGDMIVFGGAVVFNGCLSSLQCFKTHKYFVFGI